MFLQRRHMNSQEAYGMMLDITDHQGNANRATVRYCLTLIRMAALKKSKQKAASAGEDVEKLELLVGMSNDAAAMEERMEVPQRIKSRISV